MTLVFEIAAVAIALACAVHMLWLSRHGTRTGRSTSELSHRQRVLAKRIETLLRNGSTPRHH